MEIHWRTQRLKQQVLSHAQNSEITAKRMVSIKAAQDFRDLIPDSMGRAHFLRGKYKGFFSLDLEKKNNPNRLICKPGGDFQTKDGQFVKESIREFEIIKIEKGLHKDSW